MKLLYFTEGHSILDEQIRRQLVRIPEVLSEIRKVKMQSKIHGQDAVLAFLGLNDPQGRGLQGSWEEWAPVIQRGLFMRLRKAGFKYSGLLKRSRLNSRLSLESVFLPLLESKNVIEIYVVGPGFDDLKTLLDELKKKYRLHCEISFVDVIREDKKLHWFWREVLENAASPHPKPLVEYLRH